MADGTLVQVVIPFHQPIDASAEQLETAFIECYQPLIGAIGEHPGARIALHFSGHLLDHLAQSHEKELLALRDMANAGCIELLGGPFYPAIPALISETDLHGQIEMMTQFWESYLGAPPRGFWLPELAWSVEMPRLLEKTGLEYGFASANQLVAMSDGHRGLGVLHRGDSRTAVFSLDPGLSSAVPSGSVAEWIDAVIDRSAAVPGSITSVWVRAESLGLEPGTGRWCIDTGWRDEWLQAICGGRPELQPLLPAEGLLLGRPAENVALWSGCPPESEAYGFDASAIDWTDFPRLFPEVDNLHRRVNQLSSKLTEAIGTMEDEELEESWSDVLATAQRLVFSAQSCDAYWRGGHPGFSDPAVREATQNRLIKAGNILDTLIQGDEDFIATEEDDLDGDLVDEIFVSTAHLNAWLVPAQGGLVRTLDNRAMQRTALDLGVRRPEPFFEAMASAPLASETVVGGRGQPLPRLDSDLPTISDPWVPRGISTEVFDHRTSSEEYHSGCAIGLLSDRQNWDVLSNRIDEEGDCSFILQMQTRATLDGLRPRSLELSKTLEIPIDTAELRITYEADLQGDPEVFLATEIPLRLATGSRLYIDDVEVDPAQREHFNDAKSIGLLGEDGESVIVRLEGGSFDVWFHAVSTTLKTLGGYKRVDQGYLLVPALRVEGSIRASVTIQLSGAAL